MDSAFIGKRVLITGAGRGIGCALAKKLCLCGAEVFALSRTEEYLKELCSTEPFNKIVPIVSDVTDIDAVRQNLQPYLPFHMLINNAGTNILEDLNELTPAAYDQIMSTNLRAPVFISQIVAGSMIENGIKGSIVNVSSQASTIPLPQHLAYTCSKAALDALTKYLAFELGPKGIRVNAVNPTVTLTDLAKMHWSEPTKANAMLQRIALRRFAEVSDVVSAILFLLSDDSAAMINGVCLPVNGGAT